MARSSGWAAAEVDSPTLEPRRPEIRTVHAGSWHLWLQASSFGASGLGTVRGLGFAVNSPCGVTLDRDGCSAPRCPGHSTFPSGYGVMGWTCVPPPAEERH